MSLSFLHKYQRLIQSYLQGEMTTDDFAARYLELFLAETTPLTVDPYETLNDLFGATESYCPDTSLRDVDDTTETEVRAAAVVALDKLEQLLRKAS